MKLLVVALLLLAAAAPASIPPDLASSPQMVAAEHQAEALLTPCKALGLSPDSACNQNQENFVEQYVRALAGDLSAMSSTAASFDRSQVDWESAHHPEMAPFWLGMPLDQVRSCAWRDVIVILRKPNPSFVQFGSFEAHFLFRSQQRLDREMAQDACRPLSASEQDRAAQLGTQLARRIAADPIKLPSPGWWLPWPTIEPFEGHP